jgi:hypothetical protein
MKPHLKAIGEIIGWVLLFLVNGGFWYVIIAPEEEHFIVIAIIGIVLTFISVLFLYLLWSIYDSIVDKYRN